MDRDFGNWLAGFIDGEGCFIIRQVSARQAYCGFSMELRMDDAEIIREIHRRLDAGTIKMRHRTGKNGNDCPQISWNVQSTGDCVKLAAILDRCPLRAKKRRDYEIWRLALDDQLLHVDPVNKGRKRGGTGHMAYIERMLAYRDALSQTRQYDGEEMALPKRAVSSQLRLIS